MSQYFPDDPDLIDIARLAVGSSGSDYRKILKQCRAQARSRRSNLTTRIKTAATGLFPDEPEESFFFFPVDFGVIGVVCLFILNGVFSCAAFINRMLIWLHSTGVQDFARG